MLTCALAVLAACANAVSSVLQRKANKRVPQRENMSLRQIKRLLHQPVWFGGILAITAGFLLQASALGTGQLSVVEPVLARHEQVRQGWYILGDVACAAAIVAGVIMLAHAPLLDDSSGDEESASGEGSLCGVQQQPSVR